MKHNYNSSGLFKKKGKIKNIIIVYRGKSAQINNKIKEIKGFLGKQKIAVTSFLQSEFQSQKVDRVKGDLIVSLGGDGTYLKAVNLNPSVPVLGINMGSLGFLTPHEEKEALPLLKKTLQGKMFYRKDSFLKGDIL